MNKRLILAIGLLLGGCNNPFNQPTVSSRKALEICPKTPPTELILKNSSEVTLNSTLTKIGEGTIGSTETVGYKFKGKSGQKLTLNLTPSETCIWVIDPNNQIFKGQDLSETGIYIVQLAAPKGQKITYVLNMGLDVSPPSPTPIASPSQLTEHDVMEARQTVEHYFQLINSQQYQTAWNILSESQQSDPKVHPNGYSSYLDWWKGVERVELTILDQQAASLEPTFDTELTFIMKSGEQVHEKLRFFLTKEGKEWKISKAKKLNISSSSSSSTPIASKQPSLNPITKRNAMNTGQTVERQGYCTFLPAAGFGGKIVDDRCTITKIDNNNSNYKLKWSNGREMSINFNPASIDGNQGQLIEKRATSATLKTTMGKVGFCWNCQP